MCANKRYKLYGCAFASGWFHPACGSFYGLQWADNFNRRFELPAMLDRLACVAVRTAPRSRSVLAIDSVAG